MKRFLLPAIAVLIIAAFTFATNDAQKGFATVNQYQGLYVFTDSRPNAEYEYLGTVKPTGSFASFMGANSGQYTDVRDRLIKQVKKKYPNAEGLILDLKDGGVDRADVIKFK